MALKSVLTYLKFKRLLRDHILGAGHKIPVTNSAPVQSVEELKDSGNFFFKSLTKGLKILPAANKHKVPENELESIDTIVNLVNENFSDDDIMLDLESEESFQQRFDSFEDIFDESFEDHNDDMDMSDEDFDMGPYKIEVDKLEKMKVPELRKLCSSNQIDSKGRIYFSVE